MSEYVRKNLSTDARQNLRKNVRIYAVRIYAGKNVRWDVGINMPYKFPDDVRNYVRIVFQGEGSLENNDLKT